MVPNNSDAIIRLRDLDAVEMRSEAEPVAIAESFSPEQVGPGKKISLHFALTLENGELIDSCYEKAPATFVVGDGSMLPAFEQSLFGLKAEESLSCVLPPEQAFGVFNAANVQQFPRYRFPADLMLSEGLMIDFTDSAGNAQAGVVKSFNSSRVEIDFNHPLVDRHIGFRALIKTVSMPADE